MADPRVRVRMVTVIVEPVCHELGHWCRPCALSTGIRIWFVTRGDSGLILHSRVVCHECGSHDVIVDPDAATA